MPIVMTKARSSKTALLLGAVKEEDENDIASDAEDEPTTASSDNAFSAEGSEDTAGVALPPGLWDEPSDLDALASDPLAEDPWWMLMHMVIVRGIPGLCTPARMLEEFEGAGFQHMTDFDIFIMPVDRVTGKHLGYGILHFFSSSVKNHFSETFDGKDASEGQTLSVMPAKADDMAVLFLGQAGSAPAKLQSTNFCPHCGARAGDANYNFCPECGGGLGVDGRPPPEKEQQSLHQLWEGDWNQIGWQQWSTHQW